MSKLLRSGLVALLAALLLPAAYVEATCGQCYGSHNCITNNTFQICYSGVPNPEHTFSCPPDKPICTQYGDMCQSVGSPTACGDVSQCAKCDNGEQYACASLTTFGRCNDGSLMPERSPCPPDWFCSVSGAANGSPCVLKCDPDTEDTCDRVDTTTPNPNTTPGPDTVSTPSPSPITTPDPGTTASTTTAAPPVDGNRYCQNIKKAGRYAIPNDTICTSFINCFLRGDLWQGNIVNCQPAKPYFNAISACGVVRPTAAGCV